MQILSALSMLILSLMGCQDQKILKIQCLKHQGLNISSTWVCAHSWVLKVQHKFIVLQGKELNGIYNVFKNKFSLKCFARSQIILRQENKFIPLLLTRRTMACLQSTEMPRLFQFTFALFLVYRLFQLFQIQLMLDYFSYDFQIELMIRC